MACGATCVVMDEKLPTLDELVVSSVVARYIAAVLVVLWSTTFAGSTLSSSDADDTEEGLQYAKKKKFTDIGY